MPSNLFIIRRISENEMKFQVLVLCNLSFFYILKIFLLCRVSDYFEFSRAIHCTVQVEQIDCVASATIDNFSGSIVADATHKIIANVPCNELHG